MNDHIHTYPDSPITVTDGFLILPQFDVSLSPIGVQSREVTIQAEALNKLSH